MDTREEGTRGEGTEREGQRCRERSTEMGGPRPRERRTDLQKRGGGGDRDPGEMKTRMGKWGDTEFSWDAEARSPTGQPQPCPDMLASHC